MKWKILAAIAFALVLAGAVAAADLTSPSQNDEIVTVDGIDFKIPAGFSEDPDYAINGEANETGGITYTTWGKTFEKGSAILSVAVASYDGAEVNDAVAQYVGDEKMSVNGVDGYNYTMGPFNGFTYAKNGKLVIITSNDDGILEDVVVK